MATSTKGIDWKTGMIALSTLIGVGFSLYIVREQDEIKHRLDVRDAKEWKRLVDGNKARDAERKALKDNLEQILAHCRKQSSGCGLPDTLTIIPLNPEIISIEQTMALSIEDK